MLALLAARLARSGGGAIAESAAVLSAGWSAGAGAIAAGSASASAAAATAATAAPRSSAPPLPLCAVAARSFSAAAEKPAPAWPAHLPAHLDTPAAREELARRDAERRAALERRASRPGAKYREDLRAFNAARAAWRREMAGLRTRWLAEHLSAGRQRAARAEAARAESARLRAARERAEREGRRGAALAREVRAAERAVLAAERALASAQRDAIRGNVLAHYRAQRREAVLEASRSWVPPEELAARVRSALERPERL